VAGLFLPVQLGRAEAQVLDSARGHEDGCDRPSGPPNSANVLSDGGPVVMARYFGVTEDYEHGVLGDALEAEGLLVRYDNGERVICDTVLAGPGRVFEDTAPRLADLDGDGVSEVIAVASHQDFGARLELYGYPALGQDFQLLAHTPYIGTAFRWLAPVGVADFDRDGRTDIAYVETPHLGKLLKIVTPEGDRLVEILRPQPAFPIIGSASRSSPAGSGIVAKGRRWCSQIEDGVASWPFGSRPEGSFPAISDRSTHAKEWKQRVSASGVSETKGSAKFPRK